MRSSRLFRQPTFLLTKYCITTEEKEVWIKLHRCEKTRARVSKQTKKQAMKSKQYYEKICYFHTILLKINILENNFLKKKLTRKRNKSSNLPDRPIKYLEMKPNRILRVIFSEFWIWISDTIIRPLTFSYLIRIEHEMPDMLQWKAIALELNCSTIYSRFIFPCLIYF